MGELICGIFQLSSRTMYTSGTGSQAKKFIPYEKYIDSKNVEQFHVSIPHGQRTVLIDLYAIIRVYSISKAKIAYGNIEKIIGPVGDISAEMEYMKHICTIDWINDKKIPGDYLVDMNAKTRIDLTGITSLITYSIDPVGCIDIDDALSIQIVPTGFTLGIHIADVTSYIPDGSPLDLEIRKRAESIYLPRAQINMIPDSLVLHYSLIEGIPKAAFSLIIKMDSECRLVDCTFSHTKIVVNKNLSYENAQKIIESKSDEALSLIYELGHKLFNKFEMASAAKKYDAHTMVEAFMILANTQAAKQLAIVDEKNVLLRCHKGSKKRLLEFDEDLELVNRANNLMMNAAEYCVGVSGMSEHHGLDQNLYTHFTSPIRRYADIIIHRMLHNMVLDAKSSTENWTLDNFPQVVSQLNKKHSKYGKCERHANLLEKILLLQKKFKGKLFELSGFIVNLNTRRAKIFIKEYDFTIDVEYFDQKIADLVFITEDEKKSEVIISRAREIKLKLFQKVKVSVMISLKIKQKIICKMIDPHLMMLFDEYRSMIDSAD